MDFGPHGVIDSFYNASGEMHEDIWEAFQRFADGGGFYYWSYHEENPEGDTFAWRYLPPETYKILVYFPEYGSYAVSGILHSYAYESRYAADCTGMALAPGQTLELTAEREYSFFGEIACYFAVSLILILCIDLGLAWAFCFREKKALVRAFRADVVLRILQGLILCSGKYRMDKVDLAVLGACVVVLGAVLQGVLYGGVGQKMENPPRKTAVLWACAWSSLLYCFIVFYLL